MSDIEKQLTELFRSGKLPHAILIIGDNPRTLKVADNLAKLVLSTENLEAHPDFIFIDSHQVEDIRRLLDILSLSAFGSRVVVLARGEELTAQAVNNLLKKIEEPSIDTRFIVLTSHAEKLLPTLRSRLMAFRLEIDAINNAAEDMSKDFLAAKGLSERVQAVLNIDPHQADLHNFLRNLYGYEIKHLGGDSAARLKAILKTFEFLDANVQANRALTFLALKW